MDASNSGRSLQHKQMPFVEIHPRSKLYPSSTLINNRDHLHGMGAICTKAVNVFIVFLVKLVVGIISVSRSTTMG